MEKFDAFNVAAWVVDGLTVHVSSDNSKPSAARVQRARKGASIALAVFAASVCVTNVSASASAADTEITIHRSVPVGLTDDVVVSPIAFWAGVAKEVERWKQIDDSDIPSPPTRF